MFEVVKTSHPWKKVRGRKSRWKWRKKKMRRLKRLRRKMRKK